MGHKDYTLPIGRNGRVGVTGVVGKLKGEAAVEIAQDQATAPTKASFVNEAAVGRPGRRLALDGATVTAEYLAIGANGAIDGWCLACLPGVEKKGLVIRRKGGPGGFEEGIESPGISTFDGSLDESSVVSFPILLKINRLR